ncbi:MAG: hypothetical protein AAF514_06850 [Verrucomicrobiota bacterium]
MMSRFLLLVVSCVPGLWLASGCQSVPGGEGSGEEGEALKAVLLAGQSTYAFNRNYGSPFFHSLLNDETPANDPPPPEVDLTLLVMNQSEEAVAIYPESPDNLLTLELSGQGAVTKKRQGPRADHGFVDPGEPYLLPPGARWIFSIKRLAYGQNADSIYAYWTQPGDYLLKAKLHIDGDPDHEIEARNQVLLKVLASE